MSKSWPSVILGEVLTERKETPAPDDLASGGIRIVSKIGFDAGRIELRADGETKTGMILARPGDLVISGINAAKGAVAIYGPENTEPIAATIHYGAYTPKPGKADLKFLWWFFRSKVFRDILADNVPGGIKTELKAKRLLPIPIPLPPLAEQRRIVYSIEELVAHIQEAQFLRKQVTQEAEALIRARLNTVAASFKSDGQLGDILLAKPRNGWSARCDNADDGTPILSLGAITGYRYRSSEIKRTSMHAPQDGHFWLKKDDLLISRSNTPELVGHAAIYDGNPSPCIYPDLMMRLALNAEAVDLHFVWYWLQAPQVREYIGRKAKGTSPTMKKISQPIVMAIPFPSSLKISDQQRIVAELDALRAEVDRLKTLQAETAAELDALLPSILDRAFKGEL